jgi:hypothetical protein
MFGQAVSKAGFPLANFVTRSGFFRSRMRVHKCYIAIKFANRLLRRKKELEWFLLVRTFSRRKKSLAKKISKFPLCCRSAYIWRIQNLFLWKFYTLPYRSNHWIHTPSKHSNKRTEKPSEHTPWNTCGTVKCKVPFLILCTSFLTSSEQQQS